MLIGIIADTHDNMPRIKKAVSFFNKRGIALLIHAGDYIAPFSFRPYEKLKSPIFGVFGNNDGEKRGLLTKSKNVIKRAPSKINVAGKNIAVVHDINTLKKTSGLYKKTDVIIHAHTHKPEIKKEDSRLIINPGECGGWLYGKSTVCVLDVCKMKAQIYRL